MNLAVKKLLKFMASAEDEDDEVENEGELHYACFRGDTEMLLRSLSAVEDPVDINRLDSKGQTPLYVAVIQENKEIVELLLQRGADPNIRCKGMQNRTPLHNASTKDIAALLITHGADMEAQSDNGDAPLHTAVRYMYHRADVVKHLVGNLANVNATNNFKMTPLHVFCENVYDEEEFAKEMALLAYMLIQAGVDVNVKDLIGKTALHYLAGEAESYTIHSILLSNGAKVDIEDNAGYYPVHYFLKHIHVFRRQEELPDILRLYLSPQNAANLVDYQGRSALHHLVEDVNEELIHVTIDHGGNVNLRDHAGRTPLHCVSDKPNSEAAVRVLMANGADVDSADAWGRTPLMAAVDMKNKLFVEALAKSGANVNATDKVGNTALHIACYRNAPELVEMLIKRNADVHSKDANKTTPLHVAAYTGGLRCAELLTNAGADKDTPDSELKTPFEIAQTQEHFDLLGVLSTDTTQTQTVNQRVKLTNVANELMSLESVLQMIDNGKIAREKTSVEDFVSELLTSQAHGRGADEPEALEIQTAMESAITTIAKALVKADNNFQCTILHAGSTSEGTKTRCPDEFDFMVCLEKLSELVEPKFPKGDTISIKGIKGTKTLGGNEDHGKESEDSVPEDRSVSISDYTFLKVKDAEGAVPFRPFLTISGPVQSQNIPCSAMYEGFSDIIAKILFSKDFPKDPRLIPLDATLEPAIVFRWHGARYKDLEIGVDLVPALRLARWPERMRQDCKLMTPSMLRRTCLAVPKMTSQDDDDLWRCSLALIETNIFRLLRPEIRNSYIACKCMVSSEILPLVDFGDNEDVMVLYNMKNPELKDGDAFTFHEGVEGVVPSYVIKMTFLFVIEERVEQHGVGFVYDLAKLEPGQSIEISGESGAVGERGADKYAKCKTDDDAESDIDPQAVDAEVKVDREWYGPALTMHTAKRTTDFDITIVRDVFTECEKRLEKQWVPSVFNPNHNVLGSRLLSGDVEKALVYIRIINKLLAC